MLLASITILTLDAKNVGVITSVRSGLADVLAPIGDAADSVTQPLRDWWGGLTDYDELKAENEALREQLAELEGQARVDAGAADELERLRAEQDIEFVGDIPTVMAQLATGPYTNFDDNTARLDKGSDSGIEKGMTVVTHDGLVGRISDVTSRTSTIQLITDPELRIGVRLSRVAEVGVGRGTGVGTPFVVDEAIELSTQVEDGDLVFTSGLGTASFPKEIPIGEVIGSVRSQSELSQILEVEVFADLDALNVVQVLLWQPTEG